MSRNIVLALVALAFVTAPLGAQDSVTLNDLLREIVLRRVASEALSEQVAEENPGESAELPGAATTVTDFLSRLRLSADSGGLGEGDSDETLVLELNDFLGLPVNDGYKLQALLRKPALFEQLAEKIPENVRATQVGELEKGLNDLDNVSLVFTYSPMGKSMGRKPSLYMEEREALLAAVAGRGRIQTLTDELFTTQDIFGAIVQDLPDDVQETIAEHHENGTLSSLKLDSLGLEAAASLRQSLERAISVQEMRETALLEELEAARFFSFADLIANQPQFYVNIDSTSPHELVGPSKVAGKLTYEHGFVNVNSLRRTCRLRAAEARTEEEATRFFNCFQDYLTPERRAQVERGDRVALSVEYSDVEDYKVILPGDPTTSDDDVTLDLPADRKLVGSLALGRYLTFLKEGAGRSRIDVESRFEDFGDDPNRKDRWVTTLTFSQQVANEAVLTLGFVYSDQPEFRGAVDREISARLGLNYRLLRKGAI